MPKKTNVAQMPADYDPNMHGLAKELSASLDGIAEELKPHHHIEEIADNLGNIASALSGLVKVHALQAIAAHGNDEERARAVEQLDGWAKSEY